MKLRRLGSSPILVSEMCMGTMHFGSYVDEAETHRILDMAFDAGINFFDTAEAYPAPPDFKHAGRSEEIIGRWMKTRDRDAIIMATKVSGPSHGWIVTTPVRAGMTTLDRHNITRAIEGSLRRLQTDYIDLYQTHWPDHESGYDEQMYVFDELVRAGKVRIIGCANENPWGLMSSLEASRRLGTVRHQTIQNSFNINNRRFEDELAGICRREGLSLICYSPLAGGALSGKYLGGEMPDDARYKKFREAGGAEGAIAEFYLNARAQASTARIVAIAREAGLSPVTLALAWSKQHDFVASTIVGVTKISQFQAVVDAADLILPDEVMAAINAVTSEIRYPME